MDVSSIEKLRQIEGVVFGPPSQKVATTSSNSEFGWLLPPDHKAFLSRFSGASAYWGYFRIFALDQSEMGLDAWNANEGWKFAWDGRCDCYLCFAETGWGDQYAYSLTDPNLSTVYFLDALTMIPTQVASSFSEFLVAEFLRCARDPYDNVLRQAKERLGPLSITEHIIYTPSPLLGAPETVEGVIKVPARQAMIINGDVAVQLDEAPIGGRLVRVAKVLDQFGRSRIRLIWEH